MLNSLKRYFGLENVRRYIIGASVVGLACFLFIWRLGTLTPGLSSHEKSAVVASSSASKLLDNPVNAPHKIIQLFFQHFGHNGAFWMRSASVFFALIFLVSFYLLTKQWFGKFIGSLGTLILITTPWFIILARSAAPDIMLLAPIMVIASYSWLNRTQTHHNLAWSAAIAALIVALYTPGMLWFIVLGITVGHKRIKDGFAQINNALLSLGILMLLLTLVPIVWAVLKDTSLLKPLLILPSSWPTVVEFIKSFAWSILALVFKVRAHSDYILGKLPILEYAQTVLAAVGVYAMWNKARREIYGLLTLIFISLVLAALNRNIIPLTLALPSVLVFVTAGLRYLYMKWQKVFPLNPVPRTLAIVLIFVLIGAHVTYGVRYSLIAWPHNSQIRQAYVLK